MEVVVVDPKDIAEETNDREDWSPGIESDAAEETGADGREFWGVWFLMEPFKLTVEGFVWAEILRLGVPGELLEDGAGNDDEEFLQSLRQ